MKKILVPIDFSPAAKAGFDYAFQLSTITQSEIFALNVCQEVENNYSPDVSLLLQHEVEKKRKSTLAKFTGDYPNLRFSDEGASPKIHTSVRCGDIVDEIIAASIEYDVDTIIIGTKAKHNLWEYIFGSVSTNLIKQSKKPVLIIAEGLQFEKPNKIAFANDFFNEGLSLKHLDEFADIFGATIQQVHVNILPSDFSDLKEEIVESSENTTQSYTTIIRDKSVKKGLDFFIKTHHIDLLALYLPQRTFTENLLHKSVSKQLALDSKIPLLIFKE